MTRYVALLRAVNVGGRSKISMTSLRELVESLGFANVATVVQTGNVVFTARGRSPARVATAIEERLASHLGVRSKVLIRNHDEMRAVVDTNPFGEVPGEGSRFFVAFLSGRPLQERLATLDAATFAPDEFRAAERELYLWCPNGIGRSKLTVDLLERKLGVTATIRNWNTVTKIFDLVSAAE
jgi:uncharacterized protein (DUF1697 family)